MNAREIKFILIIIRGQSESCTSSKREEMSSYKACETIKGLLPNDFSSLS